MNRASGTPNDSRNAGRRTALRMERPNAENALPVESGFAVGLTDRLAPLADLVSLVIERRAYAEVPGVAADRSIARMHHRKLTSVVPMCVLPRVPASAPVTVTVTGESAVSVLIGATKPIPTLVVASDTNLAPESGSLAGPFARDVAGAAGGTCAELAPAEKSALVPPGPREELGRRRLSLPALAAPLRDLYRRIVHGLILRGPVPGDDSRAGTFAWMLA
jgi:hypothetical protein